ncbi:MAG: HTH domain-containing protein [Culicoidibacterales bacterium]
MSKKIFSELEIKKLEKNQYVKKVSAKGITYTDEMRSFFITQKLEQKPTRLIFEMAGFDIAILGADRVQSASSRWMRNYKVNGELGLKDTRTTLSGHSSKRTLSAEEKIAKLEAKMKLLEAENLFLKKLRQLEREVSK